jgi:alpha/beta superfamily hydrolase
MTERRLLFSCGELMLEGVAAIPEGGGNPMPGVVVCHPHPLYGGMMDNNVVHAICRELARASIAYLRFNFRGVEGSQGRHGDGVDEQEDVAAALTCLASLDGVDPDRIGLSGYSFGAGVALEVAPRDERAKALALVSPVLARPSPLESYTRPKLLLWGSQDIVVPVADLNAFTIDLPDPKDYEIVEGADHFWWGYEGKLGPRVASFFKETL